MTALKETALTNGGVMTDAARARFGMLHGVAAVIYLVESVLGLVLVLKSR